MRERAPSPEHGGEGGIGCSSAKITYLRNAAHMDFPGAENTQRIHHRGHRDHKKNRRNG